MTLKNLFLFLCFVCLFSCSDSSIGKKVTIGVDPNWYPLDFGKQQPYVNGFIDELLLEISKHSGIRFEKMAGNWDSLYQKLQEKEYDAVLSTLQPSILHLAHYDASMSLFDLGPVIVASKKRRHPSSSPDGTLVGFVSEEEAILFLHDHPKILIRQYDSAPSLLSALSQGLIDQAILDRVTAHAYVTDLFSNDLQVCSAPLNELGIRFVVLKGAHEETLSKFNHSFTYLKKKKRIQALLKKWELL
jgi:polar amino acid transport system substrate-binding protein